MTAIARIGAAAVAWAAAAVTAAPARATEKLPTPAFQGRYDARTERYCLRPTGSDVQRTGTRIRLIECKTQKNWAAEGLKVALK